MKVVFVSGLYRVDSEAFNICVFFFFSRNKHPALVKKRCVEELIPSSSTLGGPKLSGKPPASGSISSDVAGADAKQDTISHTTSIASSILAYRQKNGRTYHAYKDGSETAILMC
jgi:hypothetical protein